jgi:hypothetical protein
MNRGSALRSEIYTTLRDPLRALVDEIERHAGFEILVQPRSERAFVGEVIETNENTVSVLTSATCMIIESPGGVSDIPDAAFGHELLHLHRTFVQKIPHLYPKKTINGAAASALDNWLEHVVIYRRQLRLFPEFQSQLDDGLNIFWKNFPSGLSGYGLRFNAISRWMITERYASRQVNTAMVAALQKMGLEDTTRQAAKRASKALSSKEDFIKVSLDFCGIPRQNFWLRWYDTRQQKAIWRDISP